MNPLGVWWWDAQANPDPFRRVLSLALLGATAGAALFVVRAAMGKA